MTERCPTCPPPGEPAAADDPNRTLPVRGPPAEWRILIVDDHPLVRRGLKALIDGEPDLTVCGEAATHRAGLEAIASSRPDLVITDLSLGDGDGLEMVREIRSGHGSLPVLVLSMHDAPVYVERAFRAGAAGYVSKQEMGEVVLIAVRRVLGRGSPREARLCADSTTNDKEKQGMAISKELEHRLRKATRVPGNARSRSSRS